MARTILDMSMSIDGFIAAPDDVPGDGLGRDGHRLHEWLSSGGGVDPDSFRPQDETNRKVFDEVMETGAVITGRRTFDLAGQWNGDHHNGVPIFVLTRRPPSRPPQGSAEYVTDLGRPYAGHARRRETATSSCTAPVPRRHCCGRN